MGGATPVMPVIRDAFSQQAATQWVDTIDWTVRCDWLQVASSRMIMSKHNMLMRASCRTCCKFYRSCGKGFRRCTPVMLDLVLELKANTKLRHV